MHYLDRDNETHISSSSFPRVGCRNLSGVRCYSVACCKRCLLENSRGKTIKAPKELLLQTFISQKKKKGSVLTIDTEFPSLVTLGRCRASSEFNNEGAIKASPAIIMRVQLPLFWQSIVQIDGKIPYKPS